MRSFCPVDMTDSSQTEYVKNDCKLGVFLTNFTDTSLQCLVYMCYSFIKLNF